MIFVFIFGSTEIRVQQCTNLYEGFISCAFHKHHMGQFRQGGNFGCLCHFSLEALVTNPDEVAPFLILQFLPTFELRINSSCN